MDNTTQPVVQIDLTETLVPESAHYYVATVYGWVTGQSVEECKKRLKDNGLTAKGRKIHCFICRLNLPATANYDISMYMPRTEGLVWVVTDKI